MENALMVVASVLAAGLIGAGAALGAALGNSRVTSTTIECMARQPHLCRPYRIHAYYRHRYRDRSGIRQPVCRLIAGHSDTPR